jgi:protein-L-isoaspartate(D-aspartate) O-methyltransferase
LSRPDHHHPSFGERIREREAMVFQQIQARDIKDPNVLKAMRIVPRHAFVPLSRQGEAYSDYPLPIGEGQTISQPYIVAWMTELLGITADDDVLEIGSGCGYQTAVLAQLAKHVYAIERIEKLAAQAKINLERAGVENATVRIGDGFKGWPEHAPFPCILCAAAPSEVPEELISELAVGGRMVLPVGPRGLQEMIRLTKQPDGSVKREDLGAVAFVPMIDGEDHSG